MSQPYVRQIIRGWLQDPAVETPYYDTVNLDQNPPEDTWMTAEFESTLWERQTFCEGDWKEEGDVLILFTGRAGIGDGSLLAAAEKDVRTILGFRDPQRQFHITGISGVNEFSGGSANMGYQVEYTLEYEYWEKSS